MVVFLSRLGMMMGDAAMISKGMIGSQRNKRQMAAHNHHGHGGDIYYNQQQDYGRNQTTQT